MTVQDTVSEDDYLMPSGKKAALGPRRIAKGTPDSAEADFQHRRRIIANDSTRINENEEEECILNPAVDATSP